MCQRFDIGSTAGFHQRHDIRLLLMRQASNRPQPAFSTFPDVIADNLQRHRSLHRYLSIVSVLQEGSPSWA